MAGPYPPHQGTGAFGPYPDPHPNRPFAAPPVYPEAYANPYQPAPFPPPGPPLDAGPPSGAFPGPPPPVPYPRRRRWKAVAGVVVALVVIAGLVAAVLFAVRKDSASQSTVLTAATAQQAIQDYLDALSKGDIEVISRNSLCGLYDGVKDRRSDNALATLSSDAFQKQFSSVQVTGVDTIVFASPTAAQVLFSMNAVPAGRSSGSVERQGVAQVLVYNSDILVCSYVLRTAGMF
ncbi:MAG: hypothetical protein ABWY93_10580 [Mycobacterium sp.]